MILITALTTLNGLFGKLRIINNNEEFIGLVTEGDIRRSLISSFLDVRLEEIANINPLILNIDGIIKYKTMRLLKNYQKLIRY